MSLEDLFDKKERHILHEILEVLERIERRLYPHFTLCIRQALDDTDWFSLLRGEFGPMAAIIAGQSGSFVLSATASDNSPATLANPVLTADVSTIQIVPDSTDPSGLTFTVTVPPSDTETSFNLSAAADVTSPTSPTPQSISASLAVSVSPAQSNITFTLQINQK